MILFLLLKYYNKVFKITVFLSFILFPLQKGFLSAASIYMTFNELIYVGFELYKYFENKK